VVPFTSFSEFNKARGGEVWFAFDESCPLAFFAGVHIPAWTSVRKVRDGEVTKDLFAFLTTEPNVEVGAVHPKAMPVILRTPEEIDRWMAAQQERADKVESGVWSQFSTRRLSTQGDLESARESDRDALG